MPKPTHTCEACEAPCHADLCESCAAELDAYIQDRADADQTAFMEWAETQVA